jgi:hypothetical protein
MFWGLESLPEKNISRKGDMIAKKDLPMAGHEAVQTYRIGSIREIPPSGSVDVSPTRKLFDRLSSWLDILILPAKDIISRR